MRNGQGGRLHGCLLSAVGESTKKGAAVWARLKGEPVYLHGALCRSLFSFQGQIHDRKKGR